MVDINRIWITSDQHDQHTNVITYCNRPFIDKFEMSNELISRWNDTVENNDSIVYNLGDVSFGRTDACLRFLKNIKGKIYLAKGNHDKRVVLSKRYLRERFEDIQDIYRIETDKYIITMCHYQFSTIEKTDKIIINLHGHSHSKNFIYEHGQFRIDVGVDAFDYRPVKLTKLIEMIENYDR
jgi:calcineurin-like phosphoesterase family protein